MTFDRAVRNCSATFALCLSSWVFAGGTSALAQVVILSPQAAQQIQQQAQQAQQAGQQQATQAQQTAEASPQAQQPPIPPTLGAPVVPRTDKPWFLPKSGKYVAGTSVAIKDDISKATIFYTTDGSQPTTASAVYKGPIALNASIRLQAIAISPTNAASEVTKAKYVVK